MFVWDHMRFVIKKKPDFEGIIRFYKIVLRDPEIPS